MSDTRMKSSRGFLFGIALSITSRIRSGGTRPMTDVARMQSAIHERRRAGRDRNIAGFSAWPRATGRADGPGFAVIRVDHLHHVSHAATLKGVAPAPQGKGGGSRRVDRAGAATDPAE
jgi:hypothetical protein